MRKIQEGQETDYIVVSRIISTEKEHTYCKIYNGTSMIEETNDQEDRNGRACIWEYTKRK